MTSAGRDTAHSSPVGLDDCRDATRWPVYPDDVLARAAAIMRESPDRQRGVVHDLEQAFAQRMGSRFALACTNGTAAIHAAAAGLGLPPGTEVLVPSLTYWASVLPLCWHGLVPVFCDVDPDTLCIAPDEIERKITAATGAVVVVHLFGQVADLDRILPLARAHGLRVVEDAGQAIGASHRGRPVGTIGDVGCFSLQSTKYVPAGEGGLLVTEDQAIHERAVALGHYRSTETLADPALARLHRTGLGFKSVMHPVAAVLALEMLDRLDARLSAVRSNIEVVTAAIATSTPLRVPGVAAGVDRTWWARWHLEARAADLGGLGSKAIAERLLEAGVLVIDEPTPYGRGLHVEPVFCHADLVPTAWFGSPDDFVARVGERAGELPVTESLASRDVLTLPVFPAADPAFVREYARTLVTTIADLRS